MNIQTIRNQLAASVGGETALASLYSNRTMRSPSERARRELDDAAEWATETLERIATVIAANHLADHRQDDPADFVDGFVKRWAAWQHAGSRCANWMVTGPANFPVRRNQKRMDTEQRRYDELSAFAKAAPARAIKRARGAMKAAIGTAGLLEGELADLRKRLAGREGAHAVMKDCNAIVRKHKLTEAGNGALILSRELKAQGHDISDRLVADTLRPNCVGKRGWSLTNNNAEMKRLRARIAQVERKAAAVEAVEDGTADNARRTVGDCEIVENRAQDRLQLLFPGKPSDAVRRALKSGGFRWSPRNNAWQRQLTENARAAAHRVLGQCAA